MFFTSQQECSSLADKLIKGQVSRAQEAEEMFIIKKELAKTRRKLLELEEKEATESNESLREESPKIVGGETAGGGDSGGGGGGRGDDGGEDGEEEKGEEGEVPFDCGPELMVLEDEELAEQLHVKSPDHVVRQEAEVSQSVYCSSYTTFLSILTYVHVHCKYALFVCLTLLASFFLPSHLSFKNMYIVYIVCIYMSILPRSKC